MKKLILLFTMLLVAGCGEKSPPEDPESSSESAVPSSGSRKPSYESLSLPLSHADVEQLLKEAVDFGSLEERAAGPEASDLFFQNDEPYSGWVRIMYESGQVEELTRLKDGKEDGPWTTWHQNGQKASEGTFKDGKLDGLVTMWDTTGKKHEESTYEAGELHGPSTSWWPDGKKSAESTYQAGGLHGPAKSWYENGQKKSESTYREGKRDGLRTYWHESGRKQAEGTYKDGQELSAKFWNTKGQEVETWEESRE